MILNSSVPLLSGASFHSREIGNNEGERRGENNDAYVSPSVFSGQIGALCSNSIKRAAFGRDPSLKTRKSQCKFRGRNGKRFIVKPAPVSFPELQLPGHFFAALFMKRVCTGRNICRRNDSRIERARIRFCTRHSNRFRQSVGWLMIAVCLGEENKFLVILNFYHGTLDSSLIVRRN